MNLLQRIRSPFIPADDDPGADMRSRQHSVGAELRERREEFELDLDSVGEVLRIKPAYLAAIEQGRPQDLPGPTYAVGFVRAYAQYLGLDADQVLENFKAESAQAQSRPDLALPVPLGARSVPGGAILIVGLILALCGYGTWYYLATGERNRPERVAAVPAELQSMAGAMPIPVGGSTSAPASGKEAGGSKFGSGVLTTPENTAPPGAPPIPSAPAPGGSGLVASPAVAAPGAAPPAMSPPAVSPPGAAGPGAAKPATGATGAAPGTAIAAAPGGAVPRPATTAAVSSPPVPVPPTPAPAAVPAALTPSSPEGDKAGGRVEIKASADCWIQVRGGDQIVFSRVLKAGETYHVPRAGLSLRTGNAGVLAITVDGKPAPSIGGIGALRRNVSLDPEPLMAGKAIRD